MRHSHNRIIYGSSSQRNIDLNNLSIDTDGSGGMSMFTPPISSENVTVYFRDLEQHLIKHIHEAHAILGCVAWLTNKTILNILAEKNPVSIVVQKEDFLRPDLGSNRRWTTELRERYDRLSCTWERYSLPGIVSDLSVCCDPSIQPVRCVGNHNRDKHPAFPRMHHKFITFCHIVPGSEQTDGDLNETYEPPYLYPYAVWTGSFNFTENGTRSLENALFITDESIVDAYVEEWAKIVALSEPLNWDDDWVTPEWRIGT